MGQSLSSHDIELVLPYIKRIIIFCDTFKYLRQIISNNNSRASSEN